jgi:ElaB/YqjD/DUF883 family membrane-anchored ribosome-binding protein
MTNAKDEGVERLAAMLRQVAVRADDLIAAVRKEGGERYNGSIRRLERQLRRTQADLEDIEEGLLRTARSTLRSMDEAAHDHPYAAAAATLIMGAFVGLVIGIAVSRR